MNKIETLKQKIIDDLSDIQDKDILEYIAERMAMDVMPMTRQSLRLKRT